MIYWIKKQWKKISLVLGIGAIITAGSIINFSGQSLKTTKDKIINTKQDGEIITYIYKTAVEVGIAKYGKIDEDIEKRTENTQFFPKGNNEWAARVYSGNPFYKDVDDKWYQTESATATKGDFDKATDSFLKKLVKIIMPEAQAVSSSTFTSSGDGRVVAANASWATVHGATAGTSNDGSGSANVGTGVNLNEFNIYRMFIPFNTSWLPDNASISSSTANIMISAGSISNGDDDGDDWYNIVGTTSQASAIGLESEDYDQCAAITNPNEGSTRKDTSVLATEVYTIWTLDATGTAWILKDNWTLIGVREGHDAINISYGGANGTFNSLDVYMSENAGTSKDPYLDIEYTIPVVEAANKMKIIITE